MSTSSRFTEVRERALTTIETARNRFRMVDATLAIAQRQRVVSDAILAGYLALRMFIMIVPLAYVTVAGFGLGDPDDAGDVADDLGLSGAVSSSIADAAESSSRSHWLALIVGIMATLWAARGLLVALRRTHAVVWRHPIGKGTLTSPAPIVVALAAAGALAIGLTLNALRASDVPWWIVVVIGTLLWTGYWLLASLGLPHRPVRWDQLLPGAIFFGLASQGMHVATSVYFAPKLANSSNAYGSLGIALVLLTWLVVAGWVIVLAAELNAGIDEWRERHPADATAATPPEEDTWTLGSEAAERP